MDSQEISVLLNDTHVLIVDPRAEARQHLDRQFRALGAETHLATTQMEAVGLYFNLFAARKLPRMVITDWWLTPPGSSEYAFYERLQRVDRHGSCQLLVKNVTDLDATCLIACYTDTPGTAERYLAQYRTPHNHIVVQDRRTTSVPQLVSLAAITASLTAQEADRAAVEAKLTRTTEVYLKALAS